MHQGVLIRAEWRFGKFTGVLLPSFQRAVPTGDAGKRLGVDQPFFWRGRPFLYDRYRGAARSGLQPLQPVDKDARDRFRLFLLRPMTHT